MPLQFTRSNAVAALPERKASGRTAVPVSDETAAIVDRIAEAADSAGAVSKASSIVYRRTDGGETYDSHDAAETAAKALQAAARKLSVRLAFAVFPRRDGSGHVVALWIPRTKGSSAIADAIL